MVLPVVLQGCVATVGAIVATPRVMAVEPTQAVEAAVVSIASAHPAVAGPGRVATIPRSTVVTAVTPGRVMPGTVVAAFRQLSFDLLDDLLQFLL